MAKPTAPEQSSTLENLQEFRGTVDRVIFHNTENGYSVLKVQPEGRGDPFTAVGHMHDPQPGISLLMRGSWKENPRFGRQLQMEHYEILLPASSEGIRHYLGSGLIKGIRAAMAKRIVEAFGAETFRILDEEPQRLAEVKGVSEAKAETIAAAWKEHQGIRDLIMFLQPHGVSTAYAVRIYRHYGQEALNTVRENPYRLAMDIHGIGFITADTVAMKLGFARDSRLRAEAGLLYTLNRLTEEGHVFYPLEKLLEETANILGVEPELPREALKELEAEERIVLEDLEDNLTGVYLARYHHCEKGIAHYLGRILRSPKSLHFNSPEATLQAIIPNLPMRLAPEQSDAVIASLSHKALVITGGPGTGKTTVINAIIKAFQTEKGRILLAAPTGRAAKRLSETSGLEASTIHRLLEFSPREEVFLRNEDNPLSCSLLVIDEASMLDTLLMYHLLKAVPLGATVIFVGDVNQLPSVGPGNVLQDIIASGTMPVVELTEVFRQAAESEIITNAHKINLGELPDLYSKKERLSDFYFMRQDDPEKIPDLVVDLVKNHIPRRFGLDPVDEIQVLTPMHKGVAGAANLNKCLQSALNSRPEKLQRGERIFRLDDKVMQIRNNYEKDIFNGDIGRICHVHTEDRELTVRYEDKNVIYSYEELDEIVPAYAISVHKSQGSEYPAVVLPILTQHYMLLQRNLIYTGVTRGRRLVVLVGSPKAVAMAIGNNRMRMRHTWLAKRLRKGVPSC